MGIKKAFDKLETRDKMKAVIWWRVSTRGQEDLSPDTQMAETRALLESQGYEVTVTLGAVWSSPEIMDCPEMQELIELIQSGDTHAVGMYHLDRLAARPADRLFLRALCEQHSVKVIPVIGEVHEGPEGEFLDFAITWAKHQQVLRSQQSSKDGLRARAAIKGLRPAGPPPFGYEYAVAMNSKGESGTDHSRLVAANSWPIIDRIWKRFLSGASIHRIIQELHDDGVYSPKGRVRWDPSTISRMLKNPVYSGKPYGLRHHAVKPTKRLTRGYGKTSLKAATPFEEWIPLKVTVEPPVVSWEDYLAAQVRMKMNQKFSPRNAKHNYLLRGLIICAVHGSTYHGAHHKPGSFIYKCSAYRPGFTSSERCKRYIYGRTLEETIWEKASGILNNPELILSELERRKEAQSTTEQTMLESLKQIERRLEANRQAEAKLVDLHSRGDVSQDVYPRVRAGYKAERSWCEEEMERLQKKLTLVREKFVTLEQVNALRGRLGEKLAKATPENRRFVLEALETQVTSQADGSLNVTFSIPETVPGVVLTAPAIYPPQLWPPPTPRWRMS